MEGPRTCTISKATQGLQKGYLSGWIRSYIVHDRYYIIIYSYISYGFLFNKYLYITRLLNYLFNIICII